jgi:hypothetical protein
MEAGAVVALPVGWAFFVKIGVELKNDSKVGGKAVGSDDPVWPLPGVTTAREAGAGPSDAAKVQAEPNTAMAGKTSRRMSQNGFIFKDPPSRPGIRRATEPAGAGVACF